MLDEPKKIGTELKCLAERLRDCTDPAIAADLSRQIQAEETLLKAALLELQIQGALSSNELLQVQYEAAVATRNLAEAKVQQL